ncbi:MAG TPA: hypothetical protein VMH33_00280 [Solirubrobacterales bacterium]|nr:hypothetical protein [Solirubrobacterales bacterium]
MEPLTRKTEIVLVGGQALAFWSARFAGQSSEISVVASKDIDFEGSAEAARIAAALLDAKLMVPSPREPSPITGVVTFTDADGFDRTLDFIGSPRGLDAEDVRETAVRVRLDAPPAEASFWVMHPGRCMESRIYNTIELRRDDPLGLDQLRVSVPVARRWSKAIVDDDALDPDEGVRAVLSLNERIFEKCCNDRCFRAVYERHGIDPFDAVLLDDRLPQAFQGKRYPQMVSRLERARA